MTYKTKILIVDDNSDMRMSLTRLFSHYDLQTAQCGLSALQLTYKNPFDLVILDSDMPNLTGLETAREIVRINPKLPIIGYGGFHQTFNELHGPFQSVHNKINPKEMEDAVESLIRKFI